MFVAASVALGVSIASLTEEDSEDPYDIAIVVCTALILGSMLAMMAMKSAPDRRRVPHHMHTADDILPSTSRGFSSATDLHSLFSSDRGGGDVMFFMSP
jgi:hypothetical protein